jgi:hypothetical protein
MNNSILSFLKRNFLAQFLAVVLFLLLSFGVVKAVTTISTNISTAGTLSVTDVSTLGANLYSTGGALFNQASTTMFLIQNGSGVDVLKVDTTKTGAFTLTGTTTVVSAGSGSKALIVKASASMVPNLLELQNSSAAFLSGFTAAGGFLMNIASTTALTVQNGSGVIKFVVDTTNSTATSTGTFATGSDSDSATSTLQVGNSQSTSGGCIEMEREGAWYRIYINSAGGGLVVEAGNCRTDKTGVSKVK